MNLFFLNLLILMEHPFISAHLAMIVGPPSITIDDVPVGESIMQALPNEIWREIMLCDPYTYRVLALTCRSFKLNTSVAKAAFTRQIKTPNSIVYKLPCGWLHRSDDLPAKLSADEQSWYLDGELHRADGPAIICDDGSQFWFKNGRQHRDGLPAAIHEDGQQEWYIDGTLHRTDGPAIVFADGSQEWYRNGILHRDGDIPAVILPQYTNMV